MRINQLTEKAITLDDSILNPIIERIIEDKNTLYYVIYFYHHFEDFDLTKLCEYFGIDINVYRSYVETNNVTDLGVFKLTNPMSNELQYFNIVFPPIKSKLSANGGYDPKSNHIFINIVSLLKTSTVNLNVSFKFFDYKEVIPEIFSTSDFKITLEHELIHLCQYAIKNYNLDDYDNSGEDRDKYFGSDAEYDTHTNTLIRKIEKLINNKRYRPLIYNYGLLNELIKTIIDPNYKFDINSIKEFNKEDDEITIKKIFMFSQMINTDIVKYYHKHRDKKKEMKKWKLIIKNIYTHFNG